MLNLARRGDGYDRSAYEMLLGGLLESFYCLIHAYARVLLA